MVSAIFSLLRKTGTRLKGVLFVTANHILQGTDGLNTRINQIQNLVGRKKYKLKYDFSAENYNSLKGS